MKISKERFVLIVLITVFFNLANIVSNLNAQELVNLHDAYETVFYSYNFRLHNPEGFIETKWTIQGDYPEGMKLNSKGFFTGKPTLLTRHEQKRLENTKKKLKSLKKPGDSKSKKFKKELKKLKKKLRELEKKSAEAREFLFWVIAEGKVKASESESNGTTKLESASINYQVRLTVKKIPHWSVVDDMFMVGLEQSGTSSAATQQKVFFRLYKSSPFPFYIKSKARPQLGKRLQMWGNINFTSLPQQINDPLVKVPEVFSNKIKNLNINEITRAIEFILGLDIRIFDVKSKNGRKWYTLNFIGAYGATTPTTPRDSLQYFKLPVPPDENVIKKFKEKYGEELDLTGKKYISFVKPDRSKFYRQWFFGFRLKSYNKPEPIFKQKDGAIFVDKIKTCFPSFFEVSLGRNDFVVDRELILEEYERAKALQVPFEKERRWLVLRIGGILPIKIKSITIYLFGTAMLQFKRNITPLLSDPIILEPALETTFPDYEVKKITLKTEYRDYYRFGVGIDLMSFFENFF